MCGIVGFVSKEKNLNLLIDFVDSVSHRGPDKSGYKIIKVGDSYLHFGSARLSIMGLDDGDMPMEDEFGNLITYNGELYQLNNINVDNLDTTSDTRVLLNYLNKNDVSNLDSINGMFSFAFYNNKKKKGDPSKG
jgi:asparagine synthase (glutamine-hydrolysing)